MLLKGVLFSITEHGPDFSEPSVQVKNFQVVGFGVRGEKAEGKLEAGVESRVSAGLW